MRNRHFFVVFLSLLAVGSFTLPAPAKTPQKQSTKRQTNYGDGVVVTKNADGSVEVGDSSSSASSGGSSGSMGNASSYPPSPTGAPGITYKPAPAGTSHYNDGVTVKRNADGSVEVCDTDAPHMQSLGSAPVRHTTYRKARTSKSHK